jgi:CRISPR system Cascade subunit CasA
VGEFNLIDKPWIPCITLEGIDVEYGIRDTLLKAHELCEICDDSPLVTVAIHRLLLAILYRAHKGPLNFPGWKELYKQKRVKQEILDSYLNECEWQHRFNLFDSQYPFYQMSKFETKEAISINRLATECASGNNATLFDHSSDAEIVSWTLEKATRQLLACQSFALGFGRSGNAKIDGKDEVLPYSADAILLRGMNVWAQGSNLFDTLLVNLGYSNDTSIPPWELDQPHLHRDKLIGRERMVAASSGTVDRLTWQSRLVRFVPNGNYVSHMYFTQGRSADKSPNDPMKVYRASKESGISTVSLSSSKAAWRDAHSIILIAPVGSDERRPECFNVIARASLEKLIDSNKCYRTHVVGLATAPKKAGKFLLWRHERLPLPPALLGNNTMIEHLGALIQNAELVASELYNRSKGVARFFRIPDGHEPSKNE